MALRLIEMVLQEKDGGKILDLLKEHEILEHRQIRLSDGEVLVRILLDAEQSEAVLDLLEKDFSGREGNRIVILPVEATLPRAEPLPPAMSAQPPTEEKSPERISREELYEDIKDAAHCSRVYLAMVLSAIIGVLMNVDPTLPELALRTQVRVGDVMLALASGCAGAADSVRSVDIGFQ